MVYGNYSETAEDTEYSLGEKELGRIDHILNKDLVDAGVNCALLIDRSGNIVAHRDNGKCDHDLYSFAALASANIAAVDTMARIVGEKEFSLLFHKGKDESTHFSKVNSEYLLITIFGSDVSLGILRMKIAEASEKIREMWKN